jgi:hypothetical protein
MHHVVGSERDGLEVVEAKMLVLTLNSKIKIIYLKKIT